MTKGTRGFRSRLAVGVFGFGMVGCLAMTFGCAALAVPQEQRQKSDANASAIPSTTSNIARTSRVSTLTSNGPSIPALASNTPERNPNDSATANLDPSDDGVVGPPAIIEHCEGRLEQAKVAFKPAKVPITVHGDSVCGAYQAVQYLRGPEQIAFLPRPVVSCPLALALARFEGVAQRLALEYFGQRIKSITQGGTYNCRTMARFKLASEHSYANAIDIYAFSLANGKRIEVSKHFGAPNTEPAGKEGAFLRKLSRAAFDEAIFSVVVTRFFDELHRDHIHVDMAHYRTDGTR